MEPPKLHPPLCFICHRPTDSPYLCLYNQHINDRVVLCAKLCLINYNYLSESVKMIAADEVKKNERRKSL